MHKICVKELCGGDQRQPKIDVALDAAIVTSREQNQFMLSCVIDALKLLARQNLAIRGRFTREADHTEHNSNLIQVSWFKLTTCEMYLEKLHCIVKYAK